MPNTIRAGRINGDPTKGLCERVCLEVRRVFDGCRETFDNQNFSIAISQISAQAVPPFTFVSAENYGTATFEITDIQELSRRRARVTGEISIPIRVTFTDVNDVAYTGVGVLRLNRTFVFGLPPQSLTPYTIEVFAVFRSRIGSFLSDDTVSVTGCLSLVVKVIVIADMLFPTYGNCVYPDCGNCGDECALLAALPLFPE